METKEKKEQISKQNEKRQKNVATERKKERERKSYLKNSKAQKSKL